MRLLIVEDNDAMRGTLRDLLSFIQGEIIECADGSDAADAYEHHHPDLVLMDIRMPIMDGLTAARDILGKHADARIAIVTEYDDRLYHTESRRIGIEEYFMKDDLRALRQYVQDVFSQVK
ncbi:MAG: response regulator transcription factor [Bacteroidetes bacterium]|nr:response regulator transcription factor [Bacteroidota bacterium]